MTPEEITSLNLSSAQAILLTCLCTIPGCDRPKKTSRLCRLHTAMKAAGKPLDYLPAKRDGSKNAEVLKYIPYAPKWAASIDISVHFAPALTHDIIRARLDRLADQGKVIRKKFWEQRRYITYYQRSETNA